MFQIRKIIRPERGSLSMTRRGYLMILSEWFQEILVVDFELYFAEGRLALPRPVCMAANKLVKSEKADNDGKEKEEFHQINRKDRIEAVQ